MHQTRRHDDHGMITIWVLGMVLVVAVIGAVSIGAWSAFGERRELSGVADQAAQAGATAFDTDWFRTTGERRLDAAVARDRAINILERHDVSFDPTRSVIDTTTDQVVITLVKDSNAPFLDVLTDGDPVVVAVTAIARLRQD